MRQAADRGAGAAVDEIFAHAAFAGLKDGNAAFAIVRAATRDLLWANAAAAAHWGCAEEDLGAVLFGPPGSGWLGAVASAVQPGRPPQMFRTGLAPGLRMRGGTVLARAVTSPDGTTAVGFAVPGSGSAEPAPPDAWRRSAMPEPSAAPHDAETPEPDETAPEAGADLARRGQFAVLRDRLAAVVDGAAAFRFLWRTDEHDGLAQIDDGMFVRLGAPFRTGAGRFAEVVASFDAAAAETLRSAFARRTTWSGVATRLPVAEGAATVPMTLSGSPVFGPDRAFAGYRGFGTIDLGGLDAAPPKTTLRAAPVPDDAAPAVVAEPTVREPQSPAPADAPTATEPGGPTVEPTEADAPQPGRLPFANVVDLRSFQTLQSGRLAHGSAQAASSDEAGRFEPVGSPDAPAAPEPPISDEVAFLALGAALRAQIGDGPGAVARSSHATGSETSDPDASIEAASASAPPVPPPSPEPSVGVVPPAAPSSAAAVLDHLALPLLVLRDGAPVYVNAAAARLMDFPAVANAVAAGERLVAARTETGLLLRCGDGGERAIAAEAAAIEWDGAAATLWSLGATGRPAAPMAPLEPAAAMARSDEGVARSVELLDRVDDAVALLDSQGRIRRLNRRGHAWFDGLGADGAIGQTITALLAPESRAAGFQLLDEARGRDEGAAATPPSREILARTGQAAAVPMLLTVGRLGASGFSATLRDVTALKRAERDEARSRRERERDADRLPDLLARVNHEIRTPLNAILGFAEVMMDERFGPLGSPRYRDYLKDIHASGTQVVSLVGDLLDLSRIEAGRLDLDVGAVDVNKVVGEIVAQMQPEAHRKRVIVRTSLGSRIPTVTADERSTRQIVQHLLSNAVKFNDPGGQVIVSTAQDDAGAVVLRIRDTGLGMTDAEIAAALEPFHDVSPPRPANGNGLGLPLARALVGANGASLSIRSRPREGTLVEVSFPAPPPAEARRPA